MRISFLLTALAISSGCVPSSPTPPATMVVNNLASSVVSDSPASTPTALPMPPATQSVVTPIATPPAPEPVGPPLSTRADVQAFINDMVRRHGFDANQLRDVFAQVHSQPEIIAKMTRPVEAKPWHEYRRIFLTETRIANGRQFLRDHRDALIRAEQRYGVPAAIITAIIGVETAYGRFLGPHRVIDALSTLGFDYPRRAAFFRQELEQFLLLTRAEKISPLIPMGSYAGAMGWPQFMPSSYRTYAVDFNGDGIRNLWTDPSDAIGSVGNYLARNQWQAGQPVAIPVQVTSTAAALATTRPANPARSVTQWRQQGVTADSACTGMVPYLGQTSPCTAHTPQAALFRLTAEQGAEYWLGFANFRVITRYNPSVLYAMAVYQLSQAIRSESDPSESVMQ